MAPEPELPQHIEMTQSRRVALPLPNHGAGGYRWTCEVTSGADSVRAAVSFAAADDDSRDTHRGQVLVLQGVRPGDATVVLREARSWEQASAAGVVVSVQVTAEQVESEQSGETDAQQ